MSKKPFTPRRSPKVVKAGALNPNAATEDRYYRALRRLINDMTSQVSSDLKQLFDTTTAETYFAQDDTISGQAKIIMNTLAAKFKGIFDIAAKPLAEGMVGAESKNSAASLKASMNKLSQGLTIKTDILTGDLKNILSASVQENVALIKSIPAQYLTQVQGAVMRSITSGNGLQDLVPFLEKQEGVTLRRARIIARDQTRKAFANINAARMDKLGITEFEWLHSAGGQKPRKLHEQMSGKIYSLKNPPVIDQKTGERGIPGQLINCRCRMIPVIKFED